MGSVGKLYRSNYSAGCGIFLGPGVKSCPLHWQVDLYPLYYQRSPQVSKLESVLRTRTPKAERDSGTL